MEAAPEVLGQRDEAGRQWRQETVGMDTTRFDAVARLFGNGMTRREALRGLLAGAATVTAGGSLLAVDDAAASKRKRRRKKRKKTTLTPPVNPCVGKNWCLDRSQTCGPAGGFGKCLVDSSNGNVCGELLFQAASCTECAAPNCANCRCVPAAGSADKCNNGPNGQDYVCVRAL